MNCDQLASPPMILLGIWFIFICGMLFGAWITTVYLAIIEESRR